MKKVMIFAVLLTVATYGIDLISETPLGGFNAKFIRVEHNTAMLFSLDTLTGDVTTKFVDCADPVVPLIGCECVIPTALDGDYYEYHPLDTDDSLFAVFSDTNAIDFYDHSGDSLVFLEELRDTSVYRFGQHLQFYDTFLIVYRSIYGFPVYDISDLDSVITAGNIYAANIMFGAYPSFDAEDGLFCTTNGVRCHIFSLEPGSFCDSIDYFGGGGDWNFFYLDIDSNYIFMEGAAVGWFEAGTLVSHEYHPMECIGAPFEIWEDYFIKAPRTGNSIAIGEIEWLPHPTWEWVDNATGKLFYIDDSLLYTITNDTLRIYDLATITSNIAEFPLMPKSPRITAFPNPFNSSVTISVDCRGLINQTPTVEIFDINGRMVAQLPSPSVPLPAGEGGNSFSLWEKVSEGRMRAEFTWTPDASLTSGVYFVQVRTSGKSVSKKIIYLR